MKFVKRKESFGDAWRQAHVTIIDLELDEIIKTEGKPAIPKEEATRVRGREVELLKGFLNAWGISNYRIVYHETGINDIRVDEISELFDKYPECEAIGSFDENLACLEEKTGKKYVLLYLGPGNLAVAEIRRH
jgi:hypothetical protein